MTQGINDRRVRRGRQGIKGRPDTQADMHTHRHTYTHIHIHTYTHTHIHIYTNS